MQTTAITTRLPIAELLAGQPTGAGTVVTGTLTGGRLRVDDELDLIADA